MFGKKGRSEINWPLMILVVIVVLIAFPAIPAKLGSFFGLQSTAPAPSGGAVAPSGACYIEDTTITLSSEEMFNPATTPGGDAKVWINGADQGLVAEGGSITASPGDRYKILWASNSTSHYGKVTEGVVPCAGTLKLNEKLFAWDVGRAESSFAVITNDDGTLNAATNLTIGLGEVTSVGVQLKSNFEDAIGNPNEADPNVLVCLYNKSLLDDLIIPQLSETAVPAQVTSVVGYNTVAWAMPAIIGDGTKFEFDMTIDADETYVAVSGYDAYIYCYIYDGDYDVDGSTGDVLFGVEDEDDNNLGLTTGGFNFTIGLAP